MPLIELETLAGEIFDLYNECNLQHVSLGPDGLAFHFKDRGYKFVESDDYWLAVPGR